MTMAVKGTQDANNMLRLGSALLYLHWRMLTFALSALGSDNDGFQRLLQLKQQYGSYKQQLEKVRTLAGPLEASIG